MPIKRKLSPRITAHVSGRTGPILGSGGSGRAAVYALLQLEYGNVEVTDHSLASAETVAAHFNKCAASEKGLSTNPVRAFSLAHRPWPQSLILPSTIITSMPPRDSAQAYHFPDDWLHSASGGVVAAVGEMSHHNAWTIEVVLTFARSTITQGS